MFYFIFFFDFKNPTYVAAMPTLRRIVFARYKCLFSKGEPWTDTVF